MLLKQIYEASEQPTDTEDPSKDPLYSPSLSFEQQLKHIDAKIEFLNNKEGVLDTFHSRHTSYGTYQHPASKLLKGRRSSLSKLRGKIIDEAQTSGVMSDGGIFVKGKISNGANTIDNPYFLRSAVNRFAGDPNDPKAASMWNSSDYRISNVKDFVNKTLNPMLEHMNLPTMDTLYMAVEKRNDIECVVMGVNGRLVWEKTTRGSSTDRICIDGNICSNHYQLSRLSLAELKQWLMPLKTGV